MRLGLEGPGPLGHRVLAWISRLHRMLTASRERLRDPKSTGFGNTGVNAL